MGKTTFSGPIVSSTGVIVKGSIISGLKPSLSGLAVSTKNTAATLTYDLGVNLNNFTGTAAQAVTLPACTEESVLCHAQTIDTAGGVNTLTFTTSGDDVFEVGSILSSRTANAVSLAVSVAGNNRITFTPAAATTNMMSIGSYIFWTCSETGIWRVSYDFHHQGTGVTGAFAFSTV
jgi:hypothetical protein